MSAFKSVFVVCLVAVAVQARVFDKCELATILRDNGVPRNQIGTWVCIANYESNFDSQAVNTANSDGSSDHGIFQINDRYWCSPPGRGCGVTCDEVKSDNLEVAIKCVRKIYDETKRQNGDGFSAWTVYSQQGHCRTQEEIDGFVEGCGL